MCPTPSDLRTALAAFTINPIPAAIRNELLLDTEFAEKVGISSKFWLPLDQNVVADSASLHHALRSAVDGGRSTFLNLQDGVREKVELARLRGGAATITLRGKTYSFVNVDPLASDRRTRRRAIDRVLAATPLPSSAEEEWRALGRGRALTDREYMDFMSDLGETPEALHAELQQPNGLNAETICPNDIHYFERLVGPRPISDSLETYIANELLVARRDLYQRHPARALRRMGFSALWEPLVPFGLLKSIAYTDVEFLLKAEDPFSLLYGFELCRAYFDADSRFIGLGCSFLNKLLLDEKRSMARCNVFSASALVTATMIRRVSGVDTAPLFWTRLAALAHAGVVADALAALPDSEDFLRWASRNFNGTYTFYGIVDRRESPRWRPEWIAPDHVYTELAGRVFLAVHAIPQDARPTDWTSATDEVLAKLQKDEAALKAFFPGPFDDFRNIAPEPWVTDLIRKVEADLETATKIDTVPGLFALAYSGRCSDTIASGILRILNLPLDWPITTDSQHEVVYLQLCAHIAGNAQSVEIANSVVGRCLAEVRRARNEEIVTIIRVMLEACAAMPKPADYRRFLGGTMASACFATSDDENLAAMESAIDLLGQRERRLIPYFARARAIIRTKKGQA